MRAAAAALLVFAAAGNAAAEPIFLSRQYTRCTNCHFSAAGGGLLTDYAHWNVVVNGYHDRDRKADGTARTLLAQLHLYL